MTAIAASARAADEDRTGVLLRIDELTMRFGGFMALDAVSLEIRQASATAVVGPNGAGKTTVLNCVCGMYRPTRGSILLQGQRIDGLRPHQIAARGVARTFQSVEQFRALTVLELALLGRHQAFRTRLLQESCGLPHSTQEERRHREIAVELLRELGIDRYATDRLERVPYGVRKLADLARALASSPELLLLDEPTAGMGASEKDRLGLILRQVRNRLFRTVVIIDHDVQFVRELCEFSVVLDFGKKIAEGPTVEVLGDRRVIEAYLGVPAAEGNASHARTPSVDGVEGDGS